MNIIKDRINNASQKNVVQYWYVNFINYFHSFSLTMYDYMNKVF